MIPWWIPAIMVAIASILNSLALMRQMKFIRELRDRVRTLETNGLTKHYTVELPQPRRKE